MTGCRCLDAGKLIRVSSPAGTEFHHAWKRLHEVLLQLRLKQFGSLPLFIIFEFDERDALVNYDKYVRLRLKKSI